MKKKRIALVWSPHLLGESLIQLLSSIEEVQLLGPWPVSQKALQLIQEHNPDLVLFATANDNPGQAEKNFLSKILEACPELPVVRAALAENCLRVYTTQKLPARSAELMNIIRTLEVRP